MVPKMVPKIVPKMVPKIVPSIVRKEHLFSTEIPFSILKDKSRDNFGSWYMSENQNCIWGPFWGPILGPFFSFRIGLQIS